MEVDMFGRVQLIIIGGIMLFGALTGIYYSWRSGIEREALLEYNQKQLEQNIKDQEELKKKMEDIDSKRKQIEEENTAVKKAFNDKLNDISVTLESKEVISNDKSSSQVLKDTVKKLQELPK